MDDIVQILTAASDDPRFRPALQAAQAELSDVSPEQVAKLIALLEMMIQQPANYEALRERSEEEGLIDDDDLPEQFDPTLIASALVVLYKLREGGGEKPKMARGGLADMRTLAAKGRHGDTMLAHISPEEAALLKARGGAGTINPDTGLPQFFIFKKILGAVLPIAINFIAPGLGTAIGVALGATGVTAAAIGSAVIGGLSAGLTGGDPLRGAVLGGLGGGLGSAVGSTVSEGLGLGLGATGQSILGGALVGGVTGAATGQGFGRGALQGGLGGALGAAGQNLASGAGAVGAGLGAGAQMTGNMLTAGYRPREAIAGGALTGLATGIMQGAPGAAGNQRSLRPSEQVVEGLRAPGVTPAQAPGLSTSNITGQTSLTPGSPLDLGVSAPEPGGLAVAPGAGLGTPRPALSAPGMFGGMKPGNVLGGLALVNAFSSARPPAVDAAISRLSASQQEYFNRPSIVWDWGKLQTDAAQSNMGLAQFIATQWPRITSGAYNAPTQSAQASQAAQPMQPPQAQQPSVAMANGGALSAVARFVRGGGSGRDDTIEARLSDGEYVIDAETVAMLGDGSNDEGARRLDAMRRQIRAHKGKALARGKFSPNAKSPLAYLAGAKR